MQYQTIAEAYRDLEQASGRLALTARLAELLAATPDDLLPTVCYLCQGLIAPEFAGIDLGLAEKLAVRAVATATGRTPEQVASSVRETGDLGQAADQLLTETTAGQAASLPVTDVVGSCSRSPRPRAPARRAASWTCWLGCSAGPPRWKPATCSGWSPAGCGWASARRPSWTRWPRCTRAGRLDRPVLERGYNICCDLGRVAAVLVAGGLAAVERLQVQPGSPVRVMLAQRLSDAAEILAKLGGECAAEYKYDGVRVQAHRTADGSIELYTRRLERVSSQFPDVVELLRAGLQPAEAILEGEVVAFDAAAGELHPFQEVMFRRRKHGISDAVRDVPVGLFCFELLYADGADLTRLPYPERRARLAAAIPRRRSSGSPRPAS